MRDPEGKLKDIYEILKRYFGYESFRGGQEKIVRCLLSGGDALAVMPTGAGKSLCFQLPALAMDGITLVVSPLISLMQDQVRALGQNGIRAAYINSALTPRQIHLATQNAAQGIYKIIYVAPERLLTDSFLDFAQNADISLLAVDEAHCISQWGQDFRPGYLEIGTFISKLKKRPAVAAFTATATKHVRQDIISKLVLKNPLELTTGFDRPNLYFEINSVISRDDFLIRYIREHKDSSGIVYCATRKETDRVSALLSGRGFSCAAYHAGLSDDQRKQAQEDFTFDRVRTIVATTAFGMGIDKSDVRYVIHYNMPSCMEDYYQQAGRAGRDGAAADCILLYSKSDVGLQRFLITRPVENDPLTAQQRQAHLAGAEERLQQMTYYATSKSTCLRRRILNYFGESSPAGCDNCSVCIGSYDIRLKTAASAKITDEILLGLLRQYVASAARRNGVPSYAVASEPTLRELALKQPDTPELLRQIPGFSAEKIRRYGDGIINIIAEYKNMKQ